MEVWRRISAEPHWEEHCQNSTLEYRKWLPRRMLTATEVEKTTHLHMLGLRLGSGCKVRIGSFELGRSHITYQALDSTAVVTGNMPITSHLGKKLRLRITAAVANNKASSSYAERQGVEGVINFSWRGALPCCAAQAFPSIPIRSTNRFWSIPACFRYRTDAGILQKRLVDSAQLQMQMTRRKCSFGKRKKGRKAGTSYNCKCCFL